MSDYLVNDLIVRRIDAMMFAYSDILIKLWLMKETFAKVFVDTVTFNKLHLHFAKLENNSLLLTCI